MSPQIKYSQNNVLAKLRKYMKQSGMDPLSDHGYCSGISSLWLYCMWLQTQPKTSDNPRDDYDWFLSSVKSIATWDEDVDSISPELVENFNRFISHINLFQKPNDVFLVGKGGVGQVKLDEFMQDTNLRSPELEYSIGGLFTLKQLKKLLRFDIIHEHKLIYITSSRHAVALFKDGESHSYFDPNNVSGEVVTGSINEVAQYIFKSMSFYEDQPSPLTFRMFSLDGDSPAPYPKQSKILDEINPSIVGLMHGTLIGVVEPGSGWPYFGESYAWAQDKHLNKQFFNDGIVEGNLKVVKYCLTKNHEHAWLADGFVEASRRGHLDVVKFLFPKVGLAKFDDAFKQAVFGEQLGVARFLLSKTIDYDLRRQTFLIAVEGGNVDMVELFLPELRDPGLARRAFLDAAELGNLKMVKFLYEFVANDSSAIDGAFDAGTARGYLNIVRFFLSDVDEGVANEGFKNGIMYGQIEIVKMLLPKVSGDVVIKGFENAIRRSQLEIIKLLLPEVDDSDLLGRALVVAVKGGDASFMRTLLKKKDIPSVYVEQAVQVASVPALKQELGKFLPISKPKGLGVATIKLTAPDWLKSKRKAASEQNSSNAENVSKK